MKLIKWSESDIGEEEIEAVVESMRTGYVGANGPLTREFEKKFAKKVGAKYALAVCNGTCALYCALLALRYMREPLKVAVPSFTFVASANTVNAVTEDFVLVDCSRDTWNVEAKNVPKNVNLLMSVDVGGLPCDYDSLDSLDVQLLADSCESLGAKYKGKLVGSQAYVHTFSFHRAKIITTGEGGMITTDYKPLYDVMRMLANHGYDKERKPWQYRHYMRGFNFRMTEIQSAIGLVQLRKLDRYVRERREKANIYRDVLCDLVGYQHEPSYAEHPYFFFGITIDKNVDAFCEKMLKHGIEVKTWTAIHKQRPYRLYDNGSLKNAEWLSNHVVLLPIHNRLTEEQTKHVAKIVKDILK